MRLESDAVVQLSQWLNASPQMQGKTAQLWRNFDANHAYFHSHKFLELLVCSVGQTCIHRSQQQDMLPTAAR